MPHSSKLYEELQSEAYLFLINGPSGSGKTNKMFYILENFYPSDTRFAFRHYRPELIAKFPHSLRKRCFTFTTSREIVHTPCVVVLDDLPAQAYSGDYTSSDSKDFIRNLTFERHNDHRLIATSQNDILVLKGLLESVHVLNLLSYMLPSQTDTVRNIAVQSHANRILAHVMSAYPEVDRRAFAYCPETDEVFRFPYVPLDADIGKPYRGYVVEQGKLVRV